MKKFSLGLSSFITLEQYKIIFEKYCEYIDYFYFSPPGFNKQTRIVIYGNIEKDLDKYIADIVLLSKQYNIKSEYVLNTWSLTDNDIKQSKNFADTYGIFIDAVVLNQNNLDSVYKYFSKTYLIKSFNDIVRNRYDIDSTDKRFNEIVFGTGALKNPKLWKYAKQSGFETRMCLNSGCIYNCHRCTEKFICDEIVNKIISKYGIDYVYAMQSIMPIEFQQYYLYNENLDTFKLSTRTKTYRQIIDCFDSYLNPEKEEKYIKYLLNNYKLWQEYGGIGQNHVETINYKNVVRYKNEYWAKVKF
jgi:hypothetical protein